MGIRITEVSTPLGGLAWEYTDKAGKKEIPLLPALQPGRKIEVFISSICGDHGKYDHVRAELKKSIEETGLANVYLFESKGAASMPAGSHYQFALEDSDICIFLIDNADGITPGVQREIDTVKRNNIKALYYFCDETKKEKTALEQSLMGAQHAKSIPIHKFDDLIQNGFQDLIDDITATYHHYCKGRLLWKKEDDAEEVHQIDVAKTEIVQLKTIPKSVLKNIDQCSDYLVKFSVGHNFRFHGEEIHTGDIDEWGVQFLQILFEAKSIKQFNVSMFLESIKETQEEGYFQITQVRWQAIQAYFTGNIEKCVEHLESALALARETNQPTWVIKDILVDLRNQRITLCTLKHLPTNMDAQQELTDSDEELYYPLIDRVHESLHEKIVEGLYKDKTKSPYTVTMGNNYNQYGNLLASSFVIAMYNGSLTHILLIHEKVKNFVFYLSCKYTDWNLRKRLLQLSVFAGNEKEISNLQDAYPEILNQMMADDAAAIMEFCNNQPVPYKRLISQLLGFGAVGYYLSDTDFQKYETIIVKGIKDFLDDDKPVIFVGQNIFKGLAGAAYRMSQSTLVEICTLFMEREYRRWYTDMFDFIANRIDLQKMDTETAEKLIRCIIKALENEKDREQIRHAPRFLFMLRKQNHQMTEELDLKVAEYLPSFYNGVYKLETTEEQQADLPVFVQNYVDQINDHNATQGVGGAFVDYSTRYAATLRSILLWSDDVWGDSLMDSVVTAVGDTILTSKESLQIKLDSVDLLICIALKFPEHFKRNISTYDKIFASRNIIEANEDAFSSANISAISLKLGLNFLFSAMGIDVYTEILELMPYVQGDTATMIAVARMIDHYLEIKDDVILPPRVDIVVLQNVLQWLQSDNLDTRCIATRILLALARNPENENVVNRQLLSLIDSECVYIKNLILRRIGKAKGVNDVTKAHITSKCENDPCYVVRMVCAEEMAANNLVSAG